MTAGLKELAGIDFVSSAQVLDECVDRQLRLRLPVQLYTRQKAIVAENSRFIGSALRQFAICRLADACQHEPAVGALGESAFLVEQPQRNIGPLQSARDTCRVGAMYDNIAIGVAICVVFGIALGTFKRQDR